MSALRRNVWIGAVVLGLVLIGMGTFFVVKGLDAKAMIRAEMAQEDVKTSADTEKFGAPKDLPVNDERTAKAQSDVIEMHSVAIKGEVLKTGVPTTLYYTGMKKDLFVNEAEYTKARTTYLNGLTLRNALSLAVMGFGVADLVIGSGAVIILAGLATLAFGAPVLYWVGRPEALVAQERRRREFVAAPAS